MVRTQIYLTKFEQERLQKLSRQTGRSQSDLIREAIDDFLVNTRRLDGLEILSRTAVFGASVLIFRTSQS